MDKISEEIKNGISHTVFLICGEEDYLRRQKRDKLRDALISSDDTMNFSCFRGKDIDTGKLRDLSETLPFFADRRVILIEDSDFFKSGGEELAEYIEKKPDTTVFIFNEKAVDKRTKLYKAVSAKGVIADMTRQPENVLETWIASKIKAEGKKITLPDLRYFLSLTGDNMDLISNEFEKLICYTVGRDVVTRADMDAVCIRNIDDQIFKMIEEMSAHNTQAALRMFMDLLALDVNPFALLTLIVRQYNILLEAKQLEIKGAGQQECSKKLPRFYTQKYVNQAKHMKIGEIKKALEMCAETDESIKLGRMSDDTAIEVLVTELGTGIG